jgi:hypothetical protein
MAKPDNPAGENPLPKSDGREAPKPSEPVREPEPLDEESLDAVMRDCPL